MKLISFGARSKLLYLMLSFTIIKITQTHYLPPSVRRATRLSVSSNIGGIKGSQEIENPKKLKDILELQKQMPQLTIIILYYNPKCPHCINFQPIYEQTALDEDSKGSKKLFFKLDITKDSQVVKDNNIQFLPDVRVN
jgi:protein-disulfide isomerase